MTTRGGTRADLFRAIEDKDRRIAELSERNRVPCSGCKEREAEIARLLENREMLEVTNGLLIDEVQRLTDALREARDLGNEMATLAYGLAEIQMTQRTVQHET